MPTFREHDLEMLNKLLTDHENDLSSDERTAFEDMRDRLGTSVAEATNTHLTEKQRSWVRSVFEKYAPQYENLISSGKAPRGKEVPVIDLLKPENLPKRPPSKRRLED